MNKELDHIEASKNGHYYEIFMSGAFDDTGSNKHGVHASNMVNLINAENGHGFDFLPSYYDQFINVKGFMNKALDKYILRKRNADTIAKLELLKVKVQTASSTVDLMEVVNSGLEIT
jgi:hypothetical protein